jgi:hypothetical protein
MVFSCPSPFDNETRPRFEYRTLYLFLKDPATIRESQQRYAVTSIRMSRFALPAALALAALGFFAAGCGNGGGHRAATPTVSAPRSSAPCKLNRAQRRAVARALADIRRLRRIQAPVQKFSDRGAPGQEVLTGKFELDLGSSHLPLDVFSQLLHLAKTATSLCGACGMALEAEEPVLGNRTGTAHAGSCG